MDFDNDYLVYRAYIDDFASTIDLQDQLPVRVSGYCLREFEIHGEIIDWLINYLGKKCPPTLLKFLVQNTTQTTLKKVKDSPAECGFDEDRNIYQPLKLVRVVVSIVNSLILDLQDNAKLYQVPLPPTSPNASELEKLYLPPKYCVDAIKNTRRTMEDRHMIIDDFNAFFNTQDTEPTSYFGIFDGHSGSDAASYANSHLNYNISVHPKYPSDIETAMREAFLVTDVTFLKKAKAENLNSGTTALCAIYRKREKKLFVGWCGDSQALIARVGNVRQIVKKHSPEDPSERKRIEKLGGVILFWGNSYRVNGALAVSRAIGDMLHKPFVSAEPEIDCIQLDGEEDFVVLGCDGLWDMLTEDDVALTVYQKLRENPENYLKIATELCSLAKSQGSRDNISVIVVFLKEPQLIATQNWPCKIQQSENIMENMNMCDEANLVTVDGLGNTKVSLSNPFDDFNNQTLEIGANGKSSEITDLVTQQLPDITFNDNITDAMNNINNNQIQNIMASNDFMESSEIHQPPMSEQMSAWNDNNNNSDENLGPETNVDAIVDEFLLESDGGDKEKMQVELKEAEEVDHRAGGADVFQLLSQHDQEPLKDSNPFAAPEDFTHGEFTLETGIPVEAFEDKKFAELGAFIAVTENANFDAIIEESSAEAAFGEQEFMESQMKAVIDEPESLQQPMEADLELVEAKQQVESGGEESEDEWNYVKVNENQEALAALEETSEVILDSTPIEEQQEKQETSSEQIKELAENFYSEVEKPVESDVEERNEEHQFTEPQKNLTLDLEAADFDDMSQLNPDAKEFVPVSPVRVQGFMQSSPPESSMSLLNPMLNLGEDSLVSQSPRKGDTQVMEDISVPTEKDFDIEAESRPHEINVFIENGGFNKALSPEFGNLKESLQQDDKLEQEYKDEAQQFVDEVKDQSGEEYKVLESSFNDYSNGFQSVIDDPMHRSFYEGRDNEEILAPTSNVDLLNSVQPIPTFEDEPMQFSNNSVDFQSTLIEADVPQISVHEASLVSFETEKTAESFEGDQLKENVEHEIPIAAEPIEIQSEIRNVASNFAEVIAETESKVEENILNAAVPIEQKVDEVANLLGELNVPSAVEIPAPAVVEKKEATTTNKSEVKSKDAVPKKGAVTAKKAPTTVAKAPAAKAAPASTVSKNLPAKRPSTATAAAKPAAPKPATAGAPISRPKAASAGVPARPAATTATAADKPKPAAVAAPRTATLVKKAAPSTTATKPSTKPISATAAPRVAAPRTGLAAKPMTNGTAAEKKPIGSLGATSRNPTRPLTTVSSTKTTTVASKILPKTTAAPRVTSSATTRTTTTTTVRTSSARTATSPLKDKPLAVASKSPRPISAGTAKSTIKDSKSPLSGASKLSQTLPSAAAAKKPLSAVNKTSTSSTTVKKTPTKISPIKKTTTTTTTKTGDQTTEVVVTTETKTVTSDDQLLIENVYTNGIESKVNGHHKEVEENVNGEPMQMVLDTAAD